MSGDKDEFRRAFGTRPDDAARPSTKIEKPGSSSERGPQIQWAGDRIYKPYGWMPDKGADTCEVIWYDQETHLLQQGTFFHYKTLLRVGFQEISLSTNQMTVALFLADVNLFIEGYNLKPMMQRLRAYECAHIEQYSMRHHQGVTLDHLIQDEAPVITRVQTDQGLLYTSDAVKN